MASPNLNTFDSLMKPMFVYGIDIIQASQKNFKLWESSLGSFHRITDPWMVYFILFPLVYYFNMRNGLRLLWSAAITEYACVILKIVLHGPRPFWWIYESPYHVTAPRVAQFASTCETTPGTPSDRAMVISCITFILIQQYCHSYRLSMNHRWIRYAAAWSIHYLIQAAILISSTFFASSFPHQAIVGTILGAMMARQLSYTNILSMSFAGFAWIVFFMVSIYSMVNSASWVLGYDPAWANGKAAVACMKLKWIDLYKDALSENMIRTAGIVVGIGFATKFWSPTALKVTDNCRLRVKLVHAAVGMAVIATLDTVIKAPRDIMPSMYYIFLFVKYTVHPILIVTDVPFMTGAAKIISTGLIDEDPDQPLPQPHTRPVPDNKSTPLPADSHYHQGPGRAGPTYRTYQPESDYNSTRQSRSPRYTR